MERIIKGKKGNKAKALSLNRKRLGKHLKENLNCKEIFFLFRLTTDSMQKVLSAWHCDTHKVYGIYDIYCTCSLKNNLNNLQLNGNKINKNK